MAGTRIQICAAPRAQPCAILAAEDVGIGCQRELFAHLWDGLGAIRGVERYGPPAAGARTPTAAFTVDGMTSEGVVTHLAERGVFASHGDFYASTVVAKLGLADAGLVRAGCAIYTTREEIDRLLEGVAALAT